MVGKSSPVVPRDPVGDSGCCRVFVLDYFKGDGKIVIPLHQRRYVWGQRDCERLFNDLQGLVENKDMRHLLGCFAYVKKGNVREISDGQQRLTTLSILLLAIGDRFKHRDDALKYLRTPSGEIRIKLLDPDTQQYSDLIENLKTSGKFKNNYKLFAEWLSYSQYQRTTYDEYIDAIHRFYIVPAVLEDGKDNPNIVFESINTGGKRTDLGTLSKNHLLRFDKDTGYVTSQWSSIEGHLAEISSDMNQFLGAFIATKLRSGDKMSQEDAFSKICNEYGNNSKRILKELNSWASWFVDLHDPHGKSAIANGLLTNINYLGVDQVYPVLLRARSLLGNRLSEWDYEGTIATIEDYILKIQIVGVKTKPISKKIIDIFDRVLENHGNDFSNAFAKAIASDTVLKYPSDGKVKDAIKNNPVYDKLGSNGLAKCILSIINRGENITSDLFIDIESNASIEHVFPKDGNTSGWKEYLGANLLRSMMPKKDLLGNLTLLSEIDNSKAGRKSFVSKKKIYAESTDEFPINDYFGDIGQWYPRDVDNRGKYLAERLIELRPSMSGGLRDLYNSPKRRTAVKKPSHRTVEQSPEPVEEPSAIETIETDSGFYAVDISKYRGAARTESRDKAWRGFILLGEPFVYYKKWKSFASATYVIFESCEKRGRIERFPRHIQKGDKFEIKLKRGLSVDKIDDPSTMITELQQFCEECDTTIELVFNREIRLKGKSISTKYPKDPGFWKTDIIGEE